MELNFEAATRQIEAELAECLSHVSGDEVQSLLQAICAADKVFVVAVGRVMLMMQAFVKRLNHLGVEAYFVGQIDEPAITQQDLLIVASGSGESAFPVAITRVAEKYKPTIAYMGSNLNSTAASAATIRLRIPCRTKLNLPDELSSGQPMSSMFEQSLLLVCDAIALMMVTQKKIDMPSLWRKHANLE